MKMEGHLAAGGFVRNLRVMFAVVASAGGCSQPARRVDPAPIAPSAIQCDFGKPLSDECRASGESTPTPVAAPATVSPDAAVQVSVERDAKSAEPPTATPVQGRWTYDSSKDEMRGTTEQTASLESDNQVELAWPWDGGTRVSLYVSHVPKEPDAAFLWIDRGNFDCAPGYAGCDVLAKFDDGPVETFHAEKGKSNGGASDQVLKIAICAPGNATCARSTKAAPGATTDKWLAKLKASKRVMIETSLTRNGSKQFTFTTAGLKWPPSK
jgi:hypothetical protein